MLVTFGLYSDIKVTRIAAWGLDELFLDHPDRAGGGAEEVEGGDPLERCVEAGLGALRRLVQRCGNRAGLVP